MNEVNVMKTYMVIHRAPEFSWEVAEEKWRKLARFESATWITTYYNVDKGARYCVWQAPDKATLKHILSDLELAFESISEVEEKKQNMFFKKWEEYLEAEALTNTLGV
jgi:hypothetical protein